MQKNQRHTLTAAIGMLVLTATLASCGQSTVSPNPPSPNPTPMQHLNALTLGDASGKVISKLQNVSLEKYSGTQDLNKYDLIIMDGDSHTATGIATHQQLKQAVSLHKPILFVDITEDQKKNGVGKLIGFATKGMTDGYLVVPVPQVNGQSFYHIYSTTQVSARPQTIKGTSLTIASSTDANDQQFASGLVGNINESKPIKGVLQDDAPSPPGLLRMQWTYTQSNSQIIPGSARNVNSPQNFQTSWNTTYTLYYDAKQQNQIIDINTNGSVTPGTLSNETELEQAWFLGKVDVYSIAADDRLNWFTNSPVAANTETSYSSGSSFGVGVDGFTGATDYSVESSKEYQIPDWSVKSLGAAWTMHWTFASANPSYDEESLSCHKDLGGSCPWTTWYPLNIVHVKSPNILSKTQSTYNTDAVYKTAGLISDVVEMQNIAEITLADSYVHHDKVGNVYYDHPELTMYSYGDDPMGGIVFLNFGAVVPIPVQSISFNYNVAPTNSETPVIGTVTLASPAIVDTVVNLQAVSPSSSKVTVLPTIIVPAGQTTTTFNVYLNGESTDGSHTDSSVTVTALTGAATTTTQTLKTHTYAHSDMQPPNNSVKLDPQNWGAYASDAPADSSWQPGYLVRYAVSFVDINGNEAKGPWSDWENYGTTDGRLFALPFLTNVPTDPGGKAVARRIYRQFYSDVQQRQNLDGAVLQPDSQGNSIANNISTSFRDNTW